MPERDDLEAQAREFVLTMQGSPPEFVASHLAAWARRLVAKSPGGGALREAMTAMMEADTFGSAYEAVRALALAAEAELGAPRCRPVTIRTIATRGRRTGRGRRGRDG